MASLFGMGKRKPDAETLRAQRRQAQALDRQKADETKELGSRRRLMNARQRDPLLSKAGAAGVKETFGG